MRSLLIAAALLAAVATGVAGVVDLLHAQGPPTRFFGTLTIDGAPAPAGTRVIAEMEGKDCSHYPPVSLSQPAGRYLVDALGGLPGCGGEDTIVFFKVGPRYAAQTGIYNSGIFVELHLTVSGAGERPVVAVQTPVPTPSPTPEPTPTPTPTPMPTPTPTPTPTATPFAIAVVDLNSPCIPAPGLLVCDQTRQRLWNGDQAAWTARFRSEGRPDPSPDEVFVQTLGFRIEAGDPATIGAVAQSLGWPHIRIVGVRFRGRTANELDEWVELRNLGGAPQDMSGWSVRVEGTPFRWTFEPGFVLQPGQSCRFYTGNPDPDACPGSINIATSGVLRNDAGGVSLWVDFLELKADEVRYIADPSFQPPPPHLQGFS